MRKKTHLFTMQGCASSPITGLAWGGNQPAKTGSVGRRLAGGRQNSPIGHWALALASTSLRKLSCSGQMSPWLQERHS